MMTRQARVGVATHRRGDDPKGTHAPPGLPENLTQLVLRGHGLKRIGLFHEANEREQRMVAQLNHTIVWSSDQKKSAEFLADILDRPAPGKLAHFSVVELDNGVSMDFATESGEIAAQHYAFLVDETLFDHGISRILALGLNFWADPACDRPGQINHNDGGRGVYFPDPDGHLLELITRPYSGG